MWEKSRIQRKFTWKWASSNYITVCQIVDILANFRNLIWKMLLNCLRLCHVIKSFTTCHWIAKTARRLHSDTRLGSYLRLRTDTDFNPQWKRKVLDHIQFIRLVPINGSLYPLFDLNEYFRWRISVMPCKAVNLRMTH